MGRAKEKENSRDLGFNPSTKAYQLGDYKHVTNVSIGFLEQKGIGHHMGHHPMARG
jgi:hypothetical protein